MSSKRAVVLAFLTVATSCRDSTGSSEARAVDPSTLALSLVAGCPLPPAPGPNDLPALSPSLEGTVKSINGSTPTQVEFVNASCQTVTIYWLDYGGARVQYNVLAPGASYVQLTFVTHPWLIVGASGGIPLAIYMPTAAASRAVINVNHCSNFIVDYRQGSGAPWASQMLGPSQNTISQQGCMLTSLAMALTAAAVPYDPGQLNTQLSAATTPAVFTPGGGLMAGSAVDVASGGLMTLGAVAASDMDAALCAGVPVIVGVKLNASGKPGHYVLVTGKTSQGYLINDPGSATKTLLSQYGSYTIRGAVYSTARPRPFGAAMASAAGISIGAEGAALELRDAAGGVVSDGTNTIAGALYASDDLLNDETGLPIGVVTTEIMLPALVSLPYTITVIAESSGLINAYIALLGVTAPRTTVPLAVTAGEQRTVTVDVGPTGAPTVIRNVTLRSIQRSVEAGRTSGQLPSMALRTQIRQQLDLVGNALATGDSVAARQYVSALQSQLASIVPSREGFPLSVGLLTVLRDEVAAFASAIAGT